LYEEVTVDTLDKFAVKYEPSDKINLGHPSGAYAIPFTLITEPFGYFVFREVKVTFEYE